MASATSALATLAPYQPPEGLALGERFAHAKDHIDRITKKHMALTTAFKDTIQEKLAEQKGLVQALKVPGVAVLTTGCALGTSAVAGFVNGYYGGDADHLHFRGIPVDWTAGLVAHVAGYTTAAVSRTVAGEVGALLVHAVGDAAWGVGTSRWAHAKGVELAARAKAAKAGAGAAPQNGAGAGPKGGTTYPLAQK